MDGILKLFQVKLPEGYYFGITASSAENPDSFEIHKFLVSTTNSYTREEPNIQHKQQPMGHSPQQQQNQGQNQHQQQQQKSGETSLNDIPQMISDVFAGNIKSQQDQFADLHNRIQIINHRVNEIYDILQRLDQDHQNRFNDLMHRVVPMHDMTSAMIRNVEKVERTTMEVQRDLESKDMKDMLNAVHNAIQDSHNALSSGMPLAMAHSKSYSSILKFLSLIFVSRRQGKTKHDNLHFYRRGGTDHGSWGVLSL